MKAIRVFLDTNIIGGFLRDSPDRLGEFQRARQAGVRYFSSTDVASELACNPDIASLQKQLAMLRGLVSDDSFYREPQELIRAELWRLQARGLLQILVPASEIAKRLPLLLCHHGERQFQDLRDHHRSQNRQFLEEDRASTTALLELAKSTPDLPKTFEDFFRWAGAIEGGPNPLGTMSRHLGCPMTEGDWGKFRKNPSEYRVICSWMVILRLFPYSRLVNIRAPHEGDSIDCRHAVAGALCDVILTRDKAFRRFLGLAGSFLPYSIKSPDEFLAAFSGV